ncbi:predicted protein [Nematostella vectensis]|uniref:Securin n=1 Tax=Nematostella vectensis TaxID=45351 RepID=A7RS36_NEMVE|nr:uncharacterized protein LOC5517798 [Nematostella vectensis]EDO45737.1 predicted protein [Nematostella vectensis]|eukprot:XP_001637800.1 predicted protein [Nematostella vectensis]
MSSLSAAIRPHIDQENVQQPLNLKNGAQGRSFGPAKTFQANSSNAPMATPRRALGDLGNTLKTPANTGKKSLAMRPTQTQNAKSLKTPGLSRVSHATPRGKDLLKTIGSMSVKTNKKQSFQISSDTAKKAPTIDKELFEKEKMFAFVDKDKDLPQSSAVSLILKNFGRLYEGCMFTGGTHDLDEETPKMDHALQPWERPCEEQPCSLLPAFDDYSDLLVDVTDDWQTFDLPPVDIDLSGLDLP